MRKIRVLHISKYYPPYIGGLESFCHDIVMTLNSTGRYEQMVLCYNDKNNTVEEIREGVKIYRIAVQRIAFSQPLAKGYGKLLKHILCSYKPDIIQFFYPNPFAAHYLLKCKYDGVLHLNWVCDIIKQKIIKLLFVKQSKNLLKRATIVTSITPTYFSNTDFLPLYQGKKDYISPKIGDYRLNITDEQKQFSIKIKNEYENKTILFFYGRHTKYKGIKYLIKANKYLDRTSIVILIAGNGELTKALKKQAKPYNNVTFLGKLSDFEINSYLLACDIFVFPSVTRNEAFGISLAEAQFFGKPACTFSIPGSGVNWISLNNITGLEADNRDYKQFATNITKLIKDKAFYLDCSLKAKERATELFTSKTFEEKVKAIYKQLEENVSIED